MEKGMLHNQFSCVNCVITAGSNPSSVIHIVSPNPCNSHHFTKSISFMLLYNPELCILSAIFFFLITNAKSLTILSSMSNIDHLIWRKRCLLMQSSMLYLHCLGRKFSLDNREPIKLSNLLAPELGLRTVVLPITEHGSVPFSLLPMHQPPGTIMPGPRDKSSESTLSSTGSSWRNFRANGALLLIILCMSSMLRWWGCCLGGLSHDMKWRSLFTVVFLNSWALQITVWKYPSGEDIKFAQYMRTTRGRLSHPHMQ